METTIFSIKDLENLSGIKAHTIRIWEQRYDFLKPQRTPTNIRFYRSQELKTVLNISLLNRHGYKISHLNRMTADEIRDNVLALADKEARQQVLIHDLISHMVDFDIESFERDLDRYILEHGIEKTILRIVFPFLDRIGILWATNNINPAQEHLVSYIIRQKLIVGIERHAAVRVGYPADGSAAGHPTGGGTSARVGQSPAAAAADRAGNAPATVAAITPARHPGTVLLFLPEGEHHELGLLYVYYLLKKQGVPVLYLGADLPLKDLESVCTHRKPDYLYTHLTGAAGGFNLEKFVGRLGQRIGIPLVVSGALARAQRRRLPSSGVTLLESIPEVQEFIFGL